MTPNPADAVAAGAVFLDEKFPTWIDSWDEDSLPELSLTGTAHCPLGTAYRAMTNTNNMYAAWRLVLEHFDITSREAIKMGFDAAEHEAEYNRAWREEIRARLANPKSIPVSVTTPTQDGSTTLHLTNTEYSTVTQGIRTYQYEGAFYSTDALLARLTTDGVIA